MTPSTKKIVIARAQRDAKVFLSGWTKADRCPYFIGAEAHLWRKTFAAALAESKK